MITYRVGDATKPGGDGHKLLVHVCNDRGGWGSGFVLAVTKRWLEPEAVYRRSFLHLIGQKTDRTPQLGTIQCVPVGPELEVVNMIAQRGYGSPEHPRAVDYPSVRACLAAVVEHIAGKSVSVHMPRIGCHLGGGKWGEIEPIIQDTLVRAGIPVTVYDLPVDQWKGFPGALDHDQLGTV